MSADKITTDDYARLHYSYHEDTDLAIVADQLDEEHRMGWLVWLYWPRMIAKAKQAKSFGWFSTTPRALAGSIHDPIAAGGLWAARARMWDLLASADMIRVRQGEVINPSAKIDVLLVEYEKWQSLSQKERTRLSRERARVADGHEPDWILRHWSEFAFRPIGVTSPLTVDGECYAVTESGTRVTENRYTVTGIRDAVTTLDETRRNETKEGARDRALPPSVVRTIEQVRSIPGLSPRQLESNVRKAMELFPSLPDESVCEAIAAFEANVPEGSTLRSGQSWTKLRNCFAVARRRLDEEAAPSSSGNRFARVEPGSDEWRRQSIAALGSPVAT